MKNIFLFLILSSLFSSSCSNLDLTAIPTPIPSSVDTGNSVQIIPQVYYMEEIGLHPELLSPSGEEIIVDNNLVNGMPYKAQNFFTLSVTKIDGKTQARNVKIQLDIPSTIYSVKAWAPDEKAFAAIFYDKEYFNGSETCCGEAIAITNLSGEDAKTFTYHWRWNHTSQLMWSEDSSKLSVDFSGDYTPLVFNKNGELIKTLPQNSSPLFWSKDILYFVEKQVEDVQLHAYDFNSQESNLIMNNIMGYRYISYNNQKNQILLTKYIPAQSDTYEQINKFYIIDLKQKSVEEVILPEAKEVWSVRWVASPNQDFVALKGMDKNLWIFNWNTYMFQNYGQIKDLFGWYKNTNGFLVTSVNGEQKILEP
jgi:hypothetical protein